MKKSTKLVTTCTLTVIASLAFAVQSTTAATLLDYQDGETFAFAGWTAGLGSEADSLAGDGNPEATAVVGGAQIDINPGNQLIGTLEKDYFYTTDSALTGDLTATGTEYASISFDFYADPLGDSSDVAGSAQLGAYFRSESAGNDTYWFYTIDSNISGGWNTYDFSLTSGSWIGQETAPMGITLPTGTLAGDLAPRPLICKRIIIRASPHKRACAKRNHPLLIRRCPLANP